MLNHSSSEEIFSDIQLEPPLAQPKAISPCSVSGCQWEEANPHLVAFPCEESWDTDTD